MKITDAKWLAETLMKKHGVSDWTFKFDSGKRRFGSCRPSRKIITLSKIMTEINSELEVMKTILHEIAHALTPGDHHGSAWAAKCVTLGIAPARCYDAADAGRSVVTVQPNFYYGCSNCGQRISRFRRSRRGVACSACCRKFNGGKYDPKYILVEVP